MVDITSITAIVSSLKAAADIAKFLKDTNLTLEKAEVKAKIADLISALSDAKLEMANIRVGLLEKDEIIKRLQQTLELKEKLTYNAPYYWNMEKGERVGPFCQVCYDKEYKLIRLQNGGGGSWSCLSCKNTFYEDDYKPPQLSVKGFSR